VIPVISATFAGLECVLIRASHQPRKQECVPNHRDLLRPQI